MAFQVGDLVKPSPRMGLTIPSDSLGKIISIDNTKSTFYPITVKFNGRTNNDSVKFEEIELVSTTPKQPNKPMANKITNIARGLLDEDYKKLIKVGWLNSDLSLTDVGRDTVLSRYLMKNKEAFGEMASELLDEQKEDCK